jgi:putative solute:sodium symporter small subunit
MSGSSPSQSASRDWAWNQRLIALLLLVWVAVTFVVPFFAPNLYFKWLGWPFSFWMAAQGSLLVYLAIVAIYGWAMNRRDAHQPAAVPHD